MALLALSLLAGPARGTLALSDTQQLVVEAWRLVNQSYVDPARFDQVHWKRLRQKALEQPISSSSDAYDAIEAMLTPWATPTPGCCDRATTPPCAPTPRARLPELGCSWACAAPINKSL